MDENSARDQIATICVSQGVDPKSVVQMLQQYEDELQRWQKVQNLVSRETLPEIWSRHFLDSLQLLQLIDVQKGLILDFGSGGGLPAIPLALALKDKLVPVHMVESNGRKCSFLRQLIRMFDLNAVVHNIRAESLVLPSSDIVGTITARAFADLSKTFSYISGSFGDQTTAFLQKGRGYDEEIATSREKWLYDLVKHESILASDSVVLEISHLKAL
ncbi:16S rRNA (guanine(527)-N(7))-methyltransferase RsmG [Maritalea sp.]|uniref:16S rRNA (guanine(527)-N(7))-methyltransferase RsmG n=1 Tax=Maritalea sp. TaxID=2003361 RepID=UPI003EF4094A